jgi:drug/metabolite transporter (DMT)-like permease
MNVYILCAWLASFLLGAEEVMGKLTSKHSLKNPWLMNFVWTGIIMVFTVPIALANHVQLPTAWGNIIIAGLFYALSSVFYTWAIYLLDISVLSPMFNFRTVFSVLLAALILHQVLHWQQYILIGIIFVAGLIASYNEHEKLRSFFHKPILIAMIEMVIVAFYSVFTNKAIVDTGFWPTTMWIAIVAQGFLILTWPKFGKDLLKITRTQVGALSAMSVFGTTGMLAANYSYAGNVGIASTIISLPFAMVIALLFALFAPSLLERHPFKIYLIRFFSTAVMFVAALRLST